MENCLFRVVVGWKEQTTIMRQQNEKMMFIVKGKIREYVLYGNKKLLRKGSPHFLPNTEVVLCHFYHSQYRFHHKLWVRGIHKSGLLKTRPVYFKFLTDLRLEEVKSPTPKTLEFIKRNKILTTGNGDLGYSFSKVKDLLTFFEEIQEPEILTGVIQDELFIEAKDYVEKLQKYLIKKDFEEIIENHIKFPVEIKKRKESRAKETNKDKFLLKYQSEFCERVSNSILKTELETIFPSKERLIIGLTEIEIRKGYKFKISKIEVE